LLEESRLEISAVLFMTQVMLEEVNACRMEPATPTLLEETVSCTCSAGAAAVAGWGGGAPPEASMVTHAAAGGEEQYGMEVSMETFSCKPAPPHTETCATGLLGLTGVSKLSKVFEELEEQRSRRVSRRAPEGGTGKVSSREDLKRPGEVTKRLEEEDTPPLPKAPGTCGTSLLSRAKEGTELVLVLVEAPALAA